MQRGSQKGRPMSSLSDNAGGQYRDFSEMPEDVLRSLTNDMAEISRGKSLNEVRKARLLDAASSEARG